MWFRVVSIWWQTHIHMHHSINIFVRLSCFISNSKSKLDSNQYLLERGTRPYRTWNEDHSNFCLSIRRAFIEMNIVTTCTIQSTISTHTCFTERTPSHVQTHKLLNCQCLLLHDFIRECSICINKMIWHLCCMRRISILVSVHMQTGCLHLCALYSALYALISGSRPP